MSSIRGIKPSLRGTIALAMTTAVVLCGGLAASAGATPMWLAPVNISEAGLTGESPQVAVDAHGNVTAVWGRGGGGDYAVQAAVRPADGAWQAPATLSEAGVDAGGAQVAVDPEGDAIAVWDTFPSSCHRSRTIQAAVRSASTGALVGARDARGYRRTDRRPSGRCRLAWQCRRCLGRAARQPRPSIYSGVLQAGRWYVVNAS